MKREEIESLVKRGKKVYCYNKNYRVIYFNDEFFVHCDTNGFHEKLLDNKGNLIEDEENFYTTSK